MGILNLFSVWFIIDHLSKYDILFVGAESPFIFRVAIFMFALILGVLWFMWFVWFSRCIGVRWCALAVAALVLGHVALSRGLMGGAGAWGILRCGGSPFSSWSFYTWVSRINLFTAIPNLTTEH